MITLDELTRGRRERTVTLGDDWQRAKSGLYVPLDAMPLARKLSRYGPKPIGVDLFAGCGGFSLGFLEAGWNVIAAVEWDGPAVQTYMHNLCRYGDVAIHYVTEEDRKKFDRAIQQRWAEQRLDEAPEMAGSGWISHRPDAEGVKHIWIGDARKLNGVEMLAAMGLEPGDVDCVFGGPPCQGFSSAGKRQVMDPRNSLVFDFVRLVLEMEAKTCVMENVPAMCSMLTPEGENVVDAICRTLEEGGFGPRTHIKDALLQTADLKPGAATRSRRAQQADEARERRASGAASKRPPPVAARQSALPL